MYVYIYTNRMQYTPNPQYCAAGPEGTYILTHYTPRGMFSWRPRRVIHAECNVLLVYLQHNELLIAVKSTAKFFGRASKGLIEFKSVDGAKRRLRFWIRLDLFKSYYKGFNLVGMFISVYLMKLNKFSILKKFRKFFYYNCHSVLFYKNNNKKKITVIVYIIIQKLECIHFFIEITKNHFVIR